MRADARGHLSAGLAPLIRCSSGNEKPAALDANAALLERLESLRLKAGRRMGLGDVSNSVIPKPVIVSAGTSADSITSRYFTPRKCHASHEVTGAIGVASAFALPVRFDWDVTTCPPIGMKASSIRWERSRPRLPDPCQGQCLPRFEQHWILPPAGPGWLLRSVDALAARERGFECHTFKWPFADWSSRAWPRTAPHTTRGASDWLDPDGNGRASVA